MAQIIRWNPYGEMLSWRHAMDRLLEDAWGRIGDGADATSTGSLAVDLYETDADFVISANVPGVKPEDLEITIQGDTLTIKGETRSESEVHEEQYHRRERRFGSFYRQVTLPIAVKADAAEANFENGVLRLRVPKADEARERRIPVRTAPELSA